MLVSGGQILAIDHVVRNDTLVGDGSTTPLGVNTDVIATTALVSATSAKLQTEIDEVSGNFDNYYTKTETTSAIDEALKGVIRHETEVSAQDIAGNIIAVTRNVKEDGTVVFELSAKPEVSDTNIIGIDGISAKQREDLAWVLSYTGKSGNIYSAATPNLNIYEDANHQWWISAAAYPDVSNFLTSAVGYDGKALVLKDNVWVPADEANSDIITINTYSSVSSFVDAHSGDIINNIDTVSSYSAYWNEVSSFSSHSGEFMHPSKLEYAPGTEIITGYDGSAFGDKDTNYVGIDGIKVNKDTFEIGISANFLSASDKYLSANALDDLSGKWESVYNTVDVNSAAWNAHSALSASKLDASESAKFMKLEDLKGTENGEISGYGESAFYYPPFPEIPEYSGKDGIKVENYEISISADYLSANALDELSGKWEDTANTVSTASGGWNEASAFAANSGKFVTSAGFEFEHDLAYFLKKQEDESMAWSGVDLSDLGKMYSMSSLTPNRILATISAVDENTSAYVISAAPPEAFNAPDMNGEGCYATYDTANTAYKVKVDIRGNNGISAAYSPVTQQWNVGISASDYAFLFGGYINDTAITDGTILKLESNNKHLIDIDEDGYITLPETTNKFTFCINEYVDDNTTENHEYLLNKLVLSAKDNDPIVTSQNFYPSEVGSSNVTLAITVDNTAAADRQYCIVYKGSDVGVNKLHINASILEEVTSLDSTAGSVDDYTGINPIYVVDNDRQIGLGFDESVFKLTEADELGRRKLTIDAGSETIDAKKFEKMAELIDTRMTETFPIGLVCDEGTIGSNTCVSYMFRPNMTYDCTSATSAYIYNGTVDDNQVYSRIGIYEIEDTNAILVWKSALTLLKKNTQNTFSAASDTVTGTISTDKLYYACILTNNKQINDILGINGNGTADVGNPKPWCTVNNINGDGKPFGNTDFSASVKFADFGSFTGTIKPYIGLRGSIQ